MKRFLNLLCLLALLAVAVVPAGAQDSEPPLEPLVPAPSAETGQMTDESTNLWFVELAGAPIADGGRAANLQTEKANFRREAQRAGLQFTERFAFSTLWNGLSISISPAQLATLNRIAGVKAIYPVATIPIPETSPLNDPQLATALAMTGADIAQSELGYTGAGIRVAVMDTGIDYDHPDLGGCFGPGCRVAVGWDFVGDAFNADPGSASYNPVPVPDPDPDDCNGHGTHVAGIVGANGVVVGVAPGVTFGAYRVFGCDGSTTADIMIAAMERALADNMHVLNMSIGSAFQWPQYPTGAAATRLVNRGMVVVASIGNSGASGLYSASAPGLGSKVIGVASFDNTNAQFATFTVTPANLTAGYTNAAGGSPPAPLSGSLPLARTGTTASAADACAVSGPLADLTDHAVLIRRGTCGFYEKARRAELAGAAAVVLYNNVAGRINPTVAVGAGADGQPVTIPVVAISDVEGVAINNAIAAEPQTLNWQTDTLVFPNPTGGLISSFSSYGLSPDLALKPDIGAPGGQIWSTYPIEKGSYLNNSGTSMSSPHVAGAVALLLQARPNTPAQAVRGILQNSADPKNWWGNPGLGFLDNVHRQGAGMLDIDDAILATTKIEPSALALGESEAGPAVRTLVIENKSNAAVTYDLSHVPALSTGSNTFTPAFFTGFASVAFSAPSVVVPAGGSASVNVTITANPALADLSQYGGYIVFTPQGGGQVYRVPYAGLKGDYQSKPVLVPTAFGFPLIGRATTCIRIVDGACIGGNYTIPPAGYIYNLTSVFESPSILVHLDHQVRRLRVEVFDANTGRAWHRAFDLQYVGRNSTSTSFFALNWDGTTVRGNSGQVVVVPDGTYVLKLSVLKALGDDSNPAHWETWTSPAITIDRP
jgi:minor extracellular serine protease Vpr